MAVRKNSVSAYRTQIQSSSSRSRSTTSKRRVDRYVPSNSSPRRRRARSKPQPEIIIRAVAEQNSASNRRKNSSTRVSKSSTHDSKSSKNSKRHVLTWRENSLLAIVGVSAAAIVCTFVFGTLFDPERAAAKSFEKLAETYYVDYLYPTTVGIHKSNPESALAKYVDTGLPTAYLYQMLHHDNDARIDELKNFDNDYYTCNTSRTSARFFPVAPYGPHDYTVQYVYSCERKNPTK